MKPPFRHSALEAGLHDIDFWRRLNPSLHIGELPLKAPCPTLPLSAFDCREGAESMLLDGYFQAPPLIEAQPAERLARVVIDLARQGIPEVFAFVYDEFWQLFMAVGDLVEAVLGPGWCVAPQDIWTFHVPVGPDHAGWAPHRDLETPVATASDGAPKAISLWMPLTDATLDNGCMYIVPTRQDPTLRGAGSEPGSLMKLMQGTRALPATAGSVLGWNTRALHWGGSSSAKATQPRISVGAYVQSAGFDRHGIAPAAQARPIRFDSEFKLPFRARLPAIGSAIEDHAGRFPVSFKALVSALTDPRPAGHPKPAGAVRLLEDLALGTGPVC